MNQEGSDIKPERPRLASQRISGTISRVTAAFYAFITGSNKTSPLKATHKTSPLKASHKTSPLKATQEEPLPTRPINKLDILFDSEGIKSSPMSMMVIN